MPQPTGRRKLIAFIDGFNLYYGLLRDTPHYKWLDLHKAIRMLFPHYDVVQVKYFTAEVTNDQKRKDRQTTYWQALEARQVKIIKGRLEERYKDCNAKQCTFTGFRRYSIPVEKRTDVNIALHIVTDARNMKPDAICIISADTDLIPAMEMVAAYYPCQRFAFIPCPEQNLKYRRVDEFEMHRWETKRLVEEIISDCRLDETIIGPDGNEIRCPAEWAKPASTAASS